MEVPHVHLIPPQYNVPVSMVDLSTKVCPRLGLEPLVRMHREPRKNTRLLTPQPTSGVMISFN